MASAFLEDERYQDIAKPVPGTPNSGCRRRCKEDQEEHADVRFAVPGVIPKKIENRPDPLHPWGDCA
jgi:hypothetical protein